MSNTEIAKQVIDAYIDGQNATLLLLFHGVKDQIIKEFLNAWSGGKCQMAEWAIARLTSYQGNQKW